jgi:hydrogenase expression/formation protein HypC
MCLAVPGKIIEISQAGGLRMCKVDFGGVVQGACIETLPDANLGDYIIVHAGFGLSVLSEEEAQATLDALHEISDLSNKVNPS